MARESGHILCPVGMGPYVLQSLYPYMSRGWLFPMQPHWLQLMVVLMHWRVQVWCLHPTDPLWGSLGENVRVPGSHNKHRCPWVSHSRAPIWLLALITPLRTHFFQPFLQSGVTRS